jgi:fructan beta-fructosidase
MRSLIFCILGGLLCGVVAAQRNDILIADFEADDYGTWKVEGEAFGPGPAAGTLADQMAVSGFEGKRLVNSFYKGDDSTGKLTSPAFTIERRCINLLIGGGMHPDKTCINLLVAGKVVRTATGPNDRPGGSEALDWAGWDVSEYEGKEAVIEIVDMQTGGWGHINIDHIFQSDDKVITSKSRQMTFEKKYLNLPVKHGAAKRQMDILVDGKLVRQFFIELADDTADYWVFLNIGEFAGRKGELKLNSVTRDSNGLDMIYQDDKIRDAETFYKEKNRQQFHFSSRRGWNNDSNGLVYYKGEYHLFYQHNPCGWDWGNMTWGHAVSKDMMHWTELDDAIHPDSLGTIYSGSAVVDEKNTAGFQTGTERVIVCFYTSAADNPWSKGRKFTQSIAYSNDRGRTWTVYEGNPVIEHINGGNRDPKVIWHDKTKQWVMALYLDGGEMAFFTSKDLKRWELQSRLKGFHECPELFELPVDGNQKDTRWVFYGGNGDYYVGQFDGRTFKPDGEAIRFQYGNCFYASQTFNNIPKEDGRRIQIAWGRITTPGMPFNQCMLFPVELTLRPTEEGIRMFAEPIGEIRRLHRARYARRAMIVEPDQNVLRGIKGELFHIKAELSAIDAAQFGFVIRGTEVVCSTAEGTISCKGNKAPIKPADGKIKLEILVDRNSIEIYGNDGRMYMPIGGILPEENKSLELFSRQGKVRIDSLEVFELASAWK